MSVERTLSLGPHIEQLRKLRHREGKLGATQPVSVRAGI